ncbi:MAG TPA: hypothetical protein VFK70_16800 [Vicinamibacteria bacterium]|nr:hypothetical protein [Vicinamibacteria bacterium]
MTSSGFAWLIAIVLALWVAAALVVAGGVALLVAAFRRKLRWAPFLIAFPIAFGGIFLCRAEILSWAATIHNPYARFDRWSVAKQVRESNWIVRLEYRARDQTTDLVVAEYLKGDPGGCPTFPYKTGDVIREASGEFHRGDGAIDFFVSRQSAPLVFETANGQSPALGHLSLDVLRRKIREESGAP